MKKNLPNLIKIIAFVLVMYAIHTLLQPKKVEAPTAPPETQVEFAVGYNCEDFEYLSVEVNGDKQVLCGEPTPTPTPTTKAKTSWYGGYFHGRRTASGEIFDENANTLACANRFPLGTVFKLSYQGKTEIARCTDRGGFEALGRTFDLSKGLFEKLAPLSRGVIQVDYEIVNNNDQQGGGIK